MKTCVIMLTKARSVYRDVCLPDIFKYHAKFRVHVGKDVCLPKMLGTRCMVPVKHKGFRWHLPRNSFVVIKDDPNVKILS
jgi:hypothetical protein